MKFPYQEKILHFIWQYQYFDHQDLVTESQEPLQILKVGYLNANEGPDFLEAQIKIGDIIWSGSVEIHPKSKDWESHAHQKHLAYEQVILHVVYEKPASEIHFTNRPDGNFIPILVLEHRIKKDILQKCVQLVSNISPIACSDAIYAVDKVIVQSMLDKTLIQRLQIKSQAVMQLFEENNKDWDETTYQWIAQNFGFKVNAAPFLKLAKALPLKILLKHADNLIQLEALLFGVAGMLEANYKDAYYLDLKKEYQFLAHKYELKSKQLNAKDWNFLRLRPDNFPTIRISQLAAIVHKLNGLLSEFLTVDNVSELKNMLNAHASDYWQTHYVFDKESPQKTSNLGNSSKENILINSVAILWTAYFVYKGESNWIDKCINLLENVTVENNKITRLWDNLGIKSTNAYDSQSLIGLYQQFCLPRNCLNCSIGFKIIHRNIKTI